MNWLNRFWHREQMDKQLEKELAFHIDKHISDLVAQGYDPEEARRLARIDLGGPEQVKEQCRDARGARWLEDLLQDFRYALRMLGKNRGFAAVALLTLALGTGATTIMFTVVNGVLLKPLSYPEPQRLVALHGKVQQFGEPWGFSYPDFLDYQSAGQSVGPMAAWTYGGGTISEAAGAEYVEGREISSELFSVLGVPLVRGRAFLREEDRRGAAAVAIISYGLWQRAYGGRADAIGGSLTLEGKSYTIVGIAPPDFRLEDEADVFTPIGQNIEPRMQNRRAGFIHVLARLAQGLTLAQAQTQLSLIATRLAKEYPDADAERGVATHALQADLVGETRLPGVESVALTDIVPMRVGENNLPYWASAVEPPPNQTPFALASSVTPDYLNVMGIPLRHGRFFNDDDRIGHPLVVVVDEVLAQHAFGSEDAVGKPLWIPSISKDPVQIVGVVGHVRHWGLAGDDQSRVRDQIYYPFAQVPDALLHLFSSFMSIAIRTNVPPLNLVESLQRNLRGVANDQVLYDVRTMEQLVNSSLSTQRFLLVIFFVFAGLALLLACIGIYGVLAYLMTQRVPEIGVRMALGATAGNVMWLVMRQSVAMILAGVGFGTIAALAAGRSLEHSVEGMHQIEPVSFAVMIPVLVAAALLASFIPARRASRIDPSALRQD